MPAILRSLRALTLTVWVGGIVFFAFAVAPVAFTHLPTPHEAGLVVGASLRILHRIGLISGILFLAASLPFRPVKRAWLAPALVAAMLALTAALQWGILPRMERDRVAAGGEIDTAAQTDPARQDFNRQHVLSERLEGTTLILGLVAVVLTSLEGRQS